MENAAILLGLAVVGGATMAAIRLRGAPRPPTWLAVAHGALAALGLVLLLHQAATTGVPPLAQAAAAIFVLAALGGAVMFFGYHQQGKALPVFLVLGHGLGALAAYLLLMTAIFRNGWRWG